MNRDDRKLFAVFVALALAWWAIVALVGTVCLLYLFS